jgi:hypothetical protein
LYPQILFIAIFSKHANSNQTTSFHSQQLTFLEKQWLDLFQDAEYPAIKLALVLFTWYELVYYGRYLMYFCCDFIPFLRQYKIQGVSSCCRFL